MAEADAPAGQNGQDGQQPDAASQQAAAGTPDGGKDPKAQETVSRAEMNTVIGERQAAKERARQAEKALADMQEKLKAMPSAEALEAYNAWQADKDAQARDSAMQKGDAEAIENGIRAKYEPRVKALEASVSSYQAQLSSLLRDDALQLAAAASGAHNPKQVVVLLRDRVKMTEHDGRFVPDFRDADGQPMYDGEAQRVTDAATFVSMFLGQPENANLVKATARPGSGAKQPGGPPAPSDGIPTSLEAFNALPPEERDRVSRAMTQEQRLALLNVPQAGTEGYM